MGLMNPFKNIWNKFIMQPDIWFFYGFLLTFTLSARKVIKFYPINSQFNEYTGIYLYLSDIFLILTLVLWGILILQNKKEYLSNIKRYLALNKLLIKLLLIFNLWVFVSIFWSGNQYIALFRSIKILEFSLLFLYVAVRIVPYGTIQMLSPFIKGRFREGFLKSTKNAKISIIPPFTKGEIQNVPRGTFLRNILQIIIFLGLFQAIIGVWQFVLQYSIGLFWLKESIISPEIPGVAKIIINGEKFIRAYGLFPHPNILGGFLIFSVIVTWTYRKYFYRGSTLEFLKVEPYLLFFILIQTLGLLLTFSKSATLGLILAGVYICFSIVPRETIHRNLLHNMFHVEHIKRLLLLFLIALLLIIAIRPNINSLILKSLNERLIYLNLSNKIIFNNPIFGIGNGQFVPEMQKYSAIIFESWQFQPVHNVFLLIWSELGIIGLVLFIWWLWKLFRTPSPLQGEDKGELSGILTITLKSVLIGFIFIIALFDHYFWDIQQGQIVFWLVAGLLVGLGHRMSKIK